MKVIINADDCGMSELANQHIEAAINAGKITSTTVMANMHDLQGARRLYETYKNEISFGIHLNLTQGSLILYSQPLLDCGFYKMENDILQFSGRGFEKRFLTSVCREEIYKELVAQAQVLRDNNITISHIDSHHHIHTSFFMVMVLPAFSKKIKVYKIRNVRNFMPFSIRKIERNVWSAMQKLQNVHLRMTDYMCSYAEFNDYYKQVKPSTSSVIELMCHPGHAKYEEEEKLLMFQDIKQFCPCELINYNNLK